MDGTLVSNLGATELSKAMANGAMTKLHSLSLGFCDIGDPGLENLLDAWQNGKCQDLRKFSLAGNRITEKGAKTFAMALRGQALKRRYQP